ncbi:hypothetical protein R3P38DRAFT_1677685 [Favolaschia claudopus]|uniref:Chromo domain-containing protein n=1 Tax=Favolaschia claudopus TaxID=2862362 RepID=A0AAW0AE33_9AGAR
MTRFQSQTQMTRKTGRSSLSQQGRFKMGSLVSGSIGAIRGSPMKSCKRNQFLAARAKGVSHFINPEENEDIEAVVDRKLKKGTSFFEIRWRDTWVSETEMTAPELVAEFRDREAHSGDANQADSSSSSSRGNDAPAVLPPLSASAKAILVPPQKSSGLLNASSAPISPSPSAEHENPVASKDPSQAPSASHQDRTPAFTPPVGASFASGEPSSSAGIALTPTMSATRKSLAETTAIGQLHSNGAASAAPSVSQLHLTPAAVAPLDEQFTIDNQPLSQVMAPTSSFPLAHSLHQNLNRGFPGSIS